MRRRKIFQNGAFAVLIYAATQFLTCRTLAFNFSRGLESISAVAARRRRCHLKNVPLVSPDGNVSCPRESDKVKTLISWIWFSDKRNEWEPEGLEMGRKQITVHRCDWQRIVLRLKNFSSPVCLRCNLVVDVRKVRPSPSLKNSITLLLRFDAQTSNFSSLN